MMFDVTSDARFTDGNGQSVGVLEVVEYQFGARRGILMDVYQDGEAHVLFRDNRKLEIVKWKHLCKVPEIEFIGEHFKNLQQPQPVIQVQEEREKPVIRIQERKYSVSEIDAMRASILWSLTPKPPPDVACWSSPVIPNLDELVEFKLRTYMINGTDPLELQEACGGSMYKVSVVG